MALTTRRKIIVATFTASVGIAIVTVAAVVHRLVPSAGAFDRARFEAVVAEVRRQPMNAGAHARFRLVDPTDAGSLRPISENDPLARGQRAGLVWAERTKDGQLKVVIETRDAGHAGEYGFAFSEVPLVPMRMDQHWSTIDVPSKLNIVDADSKIDEHWWIVLNNLD